MFASSFLTEAPTDPRFVSRFRADHFSIGGPKWPAAPHACSLKSTWNHSDAEMVRSEITSWCCWLKYTGDELACNWIVQVYSLRWA